MAKRPPRQRKEQSAAIYRTDLAQERQARAYCEQAAQALKQQDEATAVEALTQALKLDPLHVPALDAQARILGKYNKLDTAIELMQCAILQAPDNPDRHYLLARWYAKQGSTRLAIAALHRCIELEPNKNAPRRYLAALYGTLGHEPYSQFYARKAVRSKAFAVREAKVETKLTVLALLTQASGSLRINRKTMGIYTSEGHNNLSGLLDSDHITLIRFHVDTLDSQPELLRKLPAADVIYNSITDPERCEHALHLAQKVCDRLGLPVINEPKAVLAASREGNYQRFKDNPDVILPKSVKIENTQQNARAIVAQAIQDHGFELPVIIRLAGFQGGKFMHKVDDLDSHDFAELDTELAKQPQTAYVIQYHDVSYVDERLPDTRLYPKYRAFMVGGKLYPCHHFTSKHFNVHRHNSKKLMDENAWLVAREKAYTADPAAHLGNAQWQALEAALQQSGMDYVGVDFAPATSETHQGRLVVFETNPAMRNRTRELPEGDHVQQAWTRITQAAHVAFAQHADVEPWAFVIPKGQSGGVLEIPDDVKCAEKKPLPDHAASNL